MGTGAAALAVSNRQVHSVGEGEYSYEKSNRETVEWFIVGLAAQQNYISIYVSATDGDRYLTEKYASTLGKVKVGKSSIGFDTIDDIDLDKLSRLATDARRLMTWTRLAAIADFVSPSLTTAHAARPTAAPQTRFPPP